LKPSETPQRPSIMWSEKHMLLFLHACVSPDFWRACIIFNDSSCITVSHVSSGLLLLCNFLQKTSRKKKGIFRIALELWFLFCTGNVFSMTSATSTR
jgi:hypothetical protein